MLVFLSNFEIKSEICLSKQYISNASLKNQIKKNIFPNYVLFLSSFVSNAQHFCHLDEQNLNYPLIESCSEQGKHKNVSKHSQRILKSTPERIIEGMRSYLWIATRFESINSCWLFLQRWKNINEKLLTTLEYRKVLWTCCL